MTANLAETSAFAPKTTIQKDSVQETLIIPLFARKMCTQLYPDLYTDPGSMELMNRLDYDFSEVEKQVDSARWKFGALETAMRQTDLAIEVRAHLSAYPKSAVVNLGCGLDQTAENCDNGTCAIYNVDFPDVIAVREELLGSRARVTNIAADLNNPTWFDRIDASSGVIFFAAGVFYYFDKPQMQALLSAMGERFPGGVLVFDTAGKRAVKMVRRVVQNSGIGGVDSSFYVGSVAKDLQPLLARGTATAKGYMLGYHDLKSPNVSPLFRFLAKLADGPMKMKIVKIRF